MFELNQSSFIYKILIVTLSICIAILTVFLGANVVKMRYVYPLKYKNEIIEFSKKYDVDKFLVFAVVNVESKFNPTAKSSKGAMGLMQITPKTGEYISTLLDVKQGYNLEDVNTNLEFGTYYLSYLAGKFEDVDTVICSYNAGEGRVNEWLKNESLSKDGKKLDQIPYSETREYLKKIKKSLENYKKIYSKFVDK